MEATSCPSCGAESTADVAFCSRCGAAVADPEVTGAQSASQHGDEIPRRRRVSPVLKVVAALVVVAAVSAGTAMAVVARQSAAEPAEEPRGLAVSTPAPSSTPNDQARTGQDADLSDEEIARRFGDAVFLVTVDGCGMTGSGSGFAIDEHTVVTNHHVVAIDPTPTMVDRGGREFRGEVVGMSADPDIAVIRVEDRLGTTLSWAPTAGLSEGQHLVSLGYPAPESDFAVTPGTIQSFQTRDGARQAIRYAGPLDKGNSGGPSLDSSGRVAGVVTEMALNLDGLQLVPLVFTHDAVGDFVDDAAASSDRVEADCDAWHPPVVPDDWEGDDDWQTQDASHSDGYGDDPELDALWDACEAGDMAACDDLFWASPYGSEYERFAATCGDRESAWSICLEQGLPPPPTDPIEPDWDDDWSEEASGYGDDPELDALWDACEAGDMAACDDLYMESPVGSEYEAHGLTCGGTGSLPCEFGDDDPHGYGDDPDLDDLHDDCSAGDMAACDDLYMESPVGSEYEAHGLTCGGTASFPCDW